MAQVRQFVNHCRAAARIVLGHGRPTRGDLRRAQRRASLHRLGFDYLSCSPFRIPLARLAAAQAALKESGAGSYGRRRRLTGLASNSPQRRPRTAVLKTTGVE